MAEQTGQLQSILIVDGEVLVRHAISDYMRQCGFTVVEASSTDEAVAALSDASLAIDAVLCDAQAPGSRNAFELRAWIARQEHRSGVRMIMAGNIDAVASKAAELCDEGPHLARPYDPQSVAEYVRRLLGKAGS